MALVATMPGIHHNNFEWDVTMHGPVIGTAVRF
jgi:hypothetical protein